MPDPARYRFHPLERRGVLLGLGAGRLATVGAALIVALVVVRAAPGGAGLSLAAFLLAVSLAAVCWPVAGRACVEWVPVAGRWLVGARRRRWRPGRDLAPFGVSLGALPAGPGDEPLGVAHDRRTGTWSAALTVECRSFALLDGGEKDRRLAAWGAVLASAARAGSPVYRLQWVERTRPGAGDGLRSYLAGAAAPLAGAEALHRRAADSYGELIRRAGPVSLTHEIVVVLSVHPRRAGRALRAFGRGPEAAQQLLRREIRLLQGQLRTAEVQPGPLLDAAGLAAAVRAAVDPLTRPAAVVAAPPWPVSTEERWGALRADDRWHATYWIAEWPRVDVDADFLTPLLLVGRSRVVSVTMAPVPPARARREAESARTAHLADDELRRRAGFLDTARQHREAAGARHREVELADGHGEYSYSGYVSVSAPTLEGLAEACAEVEQAAQQSHLELRRLWGQQREAWSWTLPVGRGLG